jgi:lipopolysaccharide export system protein LptA
VRAAAWLPGAALVLALFAVGPLPVAPDAGAQTAGPKKKADDQNEPVTIDADQMESFRKESLVIFTGNVVARQNNAVQHADRMEVYLDEKGDRVLRIVSTGNVKIITKDCRTATAKRVEYYDTEQRVELIGNARVWEGDNVVSGEKVTLFLNQDRSVVQSGRSERVKAVFFPKDEKQKAAEKSEKAEKKNGRDGQAPCAG